MSKNDGGPAFAAAADYGTQRGMSLRDWFAGQALNGCLAYSVLNPAWGDYHNNGSNASLAKHCYEIADAMIEARAERMERNDG